MIAVDAMGGDRAPQAIVEGALSAAKRGISVTLFGNKAEMVFYLQKHTPEWKSLPLSIVHCSQVIEMHEEPTKSVLRKKDSSLICAIKSVAQGSAQAFVSAGNSGAILVASTLLLERVEGVLRPALGGFLPGVEDSVFCLDLGANTDCKVEYLEQFACMGKVYVQLVKKLTDPRIALLSNGHEPYKGSLLVKQAYALFEQNNNLNFVGNVEARDVFYDKTDVLVCDGFVGNIMLKTAQGTVKVIMDWLKVESKKSIFSRMALFLILPILKRLKIKTDYARRGGALLLGVKRPVIVAHGSSESDAIEQAILFAHQVVLERRVEKFNSALQELISRPFDQMISFASQKECGMMP